MFSNVNGRFIIKINNRLCFLKAHSNEEINEGSPLSERSPNKTSGWFIALRILFKQILKFTKFYQTNFKLKHFKVSTRDFFVKLKVYV